MTKHLFRIDNLQKMLKFRLPTWKNEVYWDWCKSQRVDGREHHHLLGRKYYDCFIVNIPIEQHKRIHTQGYKGGEFEELFLEAIQNLLRFIDEKTE